MHFCILYFVSYMTELFWIFGQLVGQRKLFEVANRGFRKRVVVAALVGQCFIENAL